MNEHRAHITFKVHYINMMYQPLGDRSWNSRCVFWSCVGRAMVRLLSHLSLLLLSPARTHDAPSTRSRTFLRTTELSFIPETKCALSLMSQRYIVAQARASRMTLTRRTAAINLHIIMPARPYERTLVPKFTSLEHLEYIPVSGKRKRATEASKTCRSDGYRYLR